jgi:hypothetical protein
MTMRPKSTVLKSPTLGDPGSDSIYAQLFTIPPPTADPHKPSRNSHQSRSSSISR